MKTQVEFTSTKFPAYEGEEEQLNPGVWGRRLAEFLEERLAAAGIATEPMLAEDWGWYVPLTIEGVRLAICCGHQDGEAQDFVVFTDPSSPITRRGFKKVDLTLQLEQLTSALNAILADDPEINDVVWIET